MIFSAAGLTLYFNKTTFGVERLSVDGDPELVSWVCGNDFALPYGNNFLLKSDFSGGKFSAEFLYFSEVVCSLCVTQKGDAISFSYRFKNDGKKKVELKEGDLGVYTPFFDRFDDPDVSLPRRVHAHVRTEGATYIYCEKYSGDLPALGLIMTKGACYSYSLERGARKGDRGEIILRLPQMTLAPQESYECEFLLFPASGRADFFKKADGFGFLTASASDLAVFEGEEIVYRSARAITLKTEEGEIPFVDGECRITAKGFGERKVIICSKEQELRSSYFVLSKETLQKRIAFTTQKQYLADGPFRGAFAAYDNERGEVLIKKGVRSPFNLGGFRAAPLLLLLREGQKGKLAQELSARAADSVAFYDREIYRGREVSDDVNGRRARFFKRYYNYPLYATIKYEEYNYKGDLAALTQSAEILSSLYESGSVYEVTPAENVVNALRRECKDTLAGQLTSLISSAADKLIASGNKYASFKGLSYGPEIVYGSLSTLLDAYFLTGREYYLLVAEEHVSRLSDFLFPSLSYATDDVPEIFQQDRASGLTYDMSPHFTAIRFAEVYEKYSRATGKGQYLDLARRIAKACLTLFDEAGAGRRSRSAAATVNDSTLPAYEEISCGEDVVLYHFDLLFGRK